MSEVTTLKPDQVAVRLETHAKEVDAYLQGERIGLLQHEGYKFLAGCKFLEIKEETSHGNAVNGEGFVKFCQRRFLNVPHRTITFRMDFATKVLARAKEIPGFKHQPLVLGRPTAQLSVEQQEAILKMVPEIMDGRGMVEFMQDMKLLKEPELAGGLRASAEQLAKPRKPSAAEIAKAADELTRERAGWLVGWSVDKKNLVLAKTKTLQQLESARVKLGKQIETILGARISREGAKGAKGAKKKGTK